MPNPALLTAAGMDALLNPRHGLVGLSSAGPPTQAFDFYISPTGSDTNTGALTSPWAITSLAPLASSPNYGSLSGKRIGLLPGTYNVSSLMTTAGANFNNICLDIPGGNATASTYVGSSNSAGIYSPRTATIKANDNGSFGGGNANKCAMIGQSSNTGYLTIDGLVLTGASLFCLAIGQAAGTNTSPPGVVIQNCEITGNSAQSCTVASGQNVCPVAIYSGTGLIFTNNYVHDNLGWTDQQHFSAVYHWGLGTGTNGTQITYNTIVNSGGLHGKEATQANITIAYNYIDMTSMTPGGTGGNLAPILGFYDNGSNGSSGGITGTLTSIHNNVLISNAGGASVSPGLLGGTWIDMTTDADVQHYLAYPFSIYNNTCIASAALNGCGVLGFEQTAGQKPLTFYNNLFYDAGFNAVNQYGWFWTNKDAFTLCDYNIYGTHQGSSWASFSTNGTQGGLNSSVATFALWQAAIGLDAHSSTNATNPFTSAGAFALQYKVASGPAFQTGKIGGTGAACNVGAWDGIVTQIGANFP